MKHVCTACLHWNDGEGHKLCRGCDRLFGLVPRPPRRRESTWENVGNVGDNYNTVLYQQANLIELKKRLNELSPKEKAIVILHRQFDFSPMQLSNLFGVSRSLVYRVIRKTRNQ